MRMIFPLLAAAALTATGTAAAANDVNIYSYRQAVLMKPLARPVRAERTGVKANVSSISRKA